jgi:hypothetical protein
VIISNEVYSTSTAISSRTLLSDHVYMKSFQNDAKKGACVPCHSSYGLFYVQHHSMKVYGGIRGIGLRILNLDTGWWRAVSFTHQPLYPLMKFDVNQDGSRRCVLFLLGSTLNRTSAK